MSAFENHVTSVPVRLGSAPRATIGRPRSSRDTRVRNHSEMREPGPAAPRIQDGAVGAGGQQLIKNGACRVIHGVVGHDIAQRLRRHVSTSTSLLVQPELARRTRASAGNASWLVKKTVFNLPFSESDPWTPRHWAPDRRPCCPHRPQAATSDLPRLRSALIQPELRRRPAGEDQLDPSGDMLRCSGLPPGPPRRQPPLAALTPLTPPAAISPPTTAGPVVPHVQVRRCPRR